MAEKKVRVRTKKHTSEGVVAAVIGQLRWYFEDSVVAGNFHQYLNNKFDEMERDRTISQKTIVVNFVEETEGMDDEIKIGRRRIQAAIDVALYFCFHANKAHLTGKFEKAWYLAAEASRWQGMAAGTEHAFHVRRNAVKNLAGSGGRGRSDKFEPLRAFAIEAVTQKKYPSKRNAALSIKADVLNLAKTINVSLSDQQAEKTICGWIDGMTFAGRREP